MACAERRTVLQPLRALLGESGAHDSVRAVRQRRRDGDGDGGETSCREGCEELYVGQMPYTMRPDTLRWVLSREVRLGCSRCECALGAVVSWHRASMLL
jgi:hypothetical protein